MTVLIRQATQKDLPFIVDHYGPGDTPWDPFGDLDRLQKIPLEGIVIAEVYNEYAGFLYWFLGENPWFDVSAHEFAYIHEVHVLKKFQGRGIGKKLISYAVKQLKEKTKVMYISTTENNVIARHLYEDVGFREFSRSIHYRLEY